MLFELPHPRPPPAPTDGLFDRILSEPVRPAIGGLAFPLGFGFQAEDRKPVAEPNMNGLGDSSALAQLLVEIEVQAAEEDTKKDQWLCNKWFNDGTREQAANLIEENFDDTVQFLHSEARCIVPFSLITTIYLSQHHQPKPPDADTPS
ncbi:transcription factor bHLH7-like isoform X1 [Asparagus officinalis]|uniref:transcription factor bHLH7-like isoform X1 n=1 Tax=Asparagus officinalis TaxID=4686 RepID=UPI00098DEF66|nr:transcription factor bHLH7-like isoform X1 [Asparagus officinalis]